MIIVCPFNVKYLTIKNYLNSDVNADNSKDDTDDKKETDEETSDGDWYDKSH